jgi:hypothetical protein
VEIEGRQRVDGRLPEEVLDAPEQRGHCGWMVALELAQLGVELDGG